MNFRRSASSPCTRTTWLVPSLDDPLGGHSFRCAAGDGGHVEEHFVGKAGEHGVPVQVVGAYEEPVRHFNHGLPFQQFHALLVLAGDHRILIASAS